MRILYVAGFQGPELIRRRNILRNRSLAGTSKVRSIAISLAKRGHDVAILSVGAVAERAAKVHRSFKEEISLPDIKIPVYYCFCIDLPVINRYTSTISLLLNLHSLFLRENFDVAIVYNCNMEELVAAWYCKVIKKIPVVLEYEDSVVVQRVGDASPARQLRRINEIIMKRLTCGVLACSPVLAKAIGHRQQVILPGALSNELIDAARKRSALTKCGGRLKVLYCGNLDLSKGIDLLMDAVELVEHPLEIHICGKGPLESDLRGRCKRCRHPAYFHGVVSSERLISLQTSADIGVNPHRTSWHKGTLWPFKVVEYLASCGVVISSKMGFINPQLTTKLVIYEGDSPKTLSGKIIEVIDNWAEHRRTAREKMDWAAEHYGYERIGEQIEKLLKNCSAI